MNNVCKNLIRTLIVAVFLKFDFLVAQSTSLDLKSERSPLKFCLGIGTSQLFGDLGGSSGKGTHFVRDFDYQSLRYCASIGLEYSNRKSNFGFSAQFNYARLSGNDKYSAEKTRRDRNLSVITHIYSFDMRFYYSPFVKRNLRLYSGIGVFYYDPYIRYNDRRYQLRSIGTEGQLLDGGSSAYPNFSLSIPVGAQFKLYTFNKSKNELWLDVGAHFCKTDYLDDVSSVYADNHALRLKQGDVTANLADRSNSDIPGFSATGAPRGNSTYYDSYSLLTLVLKMPIEFKGRDSDKDGVPNYLDKCKDTKDGIPVDVSGCDLDSDGDGLADYIDKCPDLPGKRKNRGCPEDDADGDGVPNYMDSCANKFGSKDLNGCPDSDEDGVPDYKDPCPKHKGPINLSGCPDDDGDLVPENKDKCPNEKGSAENDGCPEVSSTISDSLTLLARGIYFNTASSEIKAESYQNLYRVIEILNKYRNLNVLVEGHTDSVGTEQNNLSLSQRRANAVRDFLILYGIDPNRIKTIGYGESKPEVDNGPKTRARNRRVVFKLFR